MGVTNGNAAFQRMLENLLEPVRDCADPPFFFLGMAVPRRRQCTEAA